VNERVERADLEQLRARVEAERARVLELRGESWQLRRVAVGSVVWPLAVSVVLAVAAVVLMIAGIRWRAESQELPAELRERRDALLGSVETEKRALEKTVPDAGLASPAQIPAGAYPKLASLRRLLRDDQEGILAWTQIGLAACTVEQKDVARMAHKKLDLEAHVSRQGSEDGKAQPGIAQAMTDVDQACRDRGIHVLVEP
jgi:hypothetical protein